MVYKAFSIPGPPGKAFTRTQTLNTVGYGSQGNMDTATTQPWRDNAWRQTSREVKGDVGSGEYRNGYGDLLWTLENYSVMSGNWNDAVSAPSPQYRIPPAQAAANMHPGQPEIDLPVFIYELKDVPQMLKHAAERAKALEKDTGASTLGAVKGFLNSGKARAEDWLNWNFGWKPLLSDLTEFIKLSNHAHAMQKAQRAYHKNGLTRQRSLGTTRRIGSNDTSIFSPSGHKARRITEWSVNSWMFTRWYLDPRWFKAYEYDYSEAMKLHLGLDPSVTQMWNAAPWTWLVDWFTDTGAVVETYSNRFGWTFGNAMIMTHTVGRTRLEPKKWTGKSAPTYGSLESVVESKLRSHITPSVNPAKVASNFFRPDQLATLASLKVAKGK